MGNTLLQGTSRMVAGRHFDDVLPVVCRFLSLAIIFLPFVHLRKLFGGCGEVLSDDGRRLFVAADGCQMTDAFRKMQRLSVRRRMPLANCSEFLSCDGRLLQIAATSRLVTDAGCQSFCEAGQKTTSSRMHNLVNNHII